MGDCFCTFAGFFPDLIFAVNNLQFPFFRRLRQNTPCPPRSSGRFLYSLRCTSARIFCLDFPLHCLYPFVLQCILQPLPLQLPLQGQQTLGNVLQLRCEEASAIMQIRKKTTKEMPHGCRPSLILLKLFASASISSPRPSMQGMHSLNAGSLEEIKLRHASGMDGGILIHTSLCPVHL